MPPNREESQTHFPATTWRPGADYDRPALAKAMRLRSDQRIILAQTVGYLRK